MKRQAAENSRVLVTGRLWLGASGASSIGAALIELLDSAQKEVIIVAYRMTAAIVDFNSALERCLSRGCIVRIVIDKSGPSIPVEDRLLARLGETFPNLSIWTFKETSRAHTNLALHAKMVIIDRLTAVVGSANFSRNGMVDNHELAIQVGATQAMQLGAVVDQLVENGNSEGILSLWKHNGD